MSLIYRICVHTPLTHYAFGYISADFFVLCQKYKLKIAILTVKKISIVLL